MAADLLAPKVPRSILLLLVGAACSAAASGRIPLAAAAAARWEFTDAAAFRWLADGGECLELHGASGYRPPHRSPLALALLREPEFGDGVLRVQARQTGREYPHRDLVIVFGWRDPAHFAYAHLASAADANAHHVMLVDGADRRPVTTARTAGVAWGDGWHDLELRRAGARVEVSFDGVVVLAAEVPPWRGQIGLGSFDDTGLFRDLRVTGR